MPHQLRHIYYIDDDRDILSVVKFSLEKVGGYQVTSQEDSRAALIDLEHITPDLIILDVMMPDMDGPTTLGKIRQMSHLKNVPIVLTTALSQGAEIEKYRALSVAGILHKPFHSLSLPETIRDFWLGFHKPDAAFDADIPADLRADYLKTLAIYHKQISTFVMQCEHGDASRTEIENMANLAHKLSGSGATYGYPDISSKARTLKDALHSISDPVKLVPAAKTFLNCLDKVLMH